MTREGPAPFAGSEDGEGPRAEEQGQPLEAAKARDGLPQSFQKEGSPDSALLLAQRDPRHTSYLQNSQIINLCYDTTFVVICYKSGRKLAHVPPPPPAPYFSLKWLTLPLGMVQ